LWTAAGSQSIFLVEYLFLAGLLLVVPLQGSSVQLQRRLLFQATAQCGFTLAHWIPEALLSRLPTGHLCCLGADLLLVVLILKVSAFPALLGEPVFDSLLGSLHFYFQAQQITLEFPHSLVISYPTSFTKKKN
jgi:hypothetical protein